jgi:hypothetical protein
MNKKRGMALKFAAIIALIVIGLASCDINGSKLTTSELNATGKSISENTNNTNKQSSTPELEKIAGTAAIGSSCFFFEFDIDGAKKFARALVPVSPGGYIKNGKLLYETVSYPLASLVFDTGSGYIKGTSKAKDGVSFSFEGLYTKANGFFGTISKSENGAVASGYLGGSPIFSNKNVANYVGIATYLFPTPTPQTLIFNVVIDFDTNTAVGTWSEAGEGWGYTLAGTIDGTVSGDSVNINASVLPAFRPYMLYNMTAIGKGVFKNKSKKTISGDFTIYYGTLVLPSLLTATRESD